MDGKREALAVFDVMANLATVPVPPRRCLMMRMTTCLVWEHVSKIIKLGPQGEGLPQGSPTNFDSVAKTSEDPLGKRVTLKQRFLKGAAPKSWQRLQASPAQWKTVDSFRRGLKENVNNLEDKMNEGFKTEGIPRKKDYENVWKMRPDLKRKERKSRQVSRRKKTQDR